MRHIKNNLYIVIFVLASALAANVESSTLNTTSEKSTNDQYDYTYIVEAGVPEMGENGTLQYDKKWSELLSKGDEKGDATL
jgi:hypothetical protein